MSCHFFGSPICKKKDPIKSFHTLTTWFLIKITTPLPNPTLLPITYLIRGAPDISVINLQITDLRLCRHSIGSPIELYGPQNLWFFMVVHSQNGRGLSCKGGFKVGSHCPGCYSGCTIVRYGVKHVKGHKLSVQNVSILVPMDSNGYFLRIICHNLMQFRACRAELWP